MHAKCLRVEAISSKNWEKQNIIQKPEFRVHGRSLCIQSSH
jgi:hypothetical protein